MTDVSPRIETIIHILEQVYPAYALLAGMQLDLFTALKDGPLRAEQIAAATGVNADKLERLLYVLVVAGVLTVTGDRFWNTPASDRFLVRGRPAFFGDAHELYMDIWQAVLRTAETVRTGVPQARHDYRLMTKDEQLAFFRGLHPAAKAAGYDLADRFDFSAYHTLVDVAGGTGGLAIALTERYPQLQATVVDLPEVTPITEHFVTEEHATDRVQVIAADVIDGTLNGAFDVATIRAFTHIISPAEVRRALKNVYSVLKPGGVVYNITRVLDNSRTSPVDTVIWDLVFLNIYDHGRCYTEQENRDWYTQAGFIDFERLVPPSGDHILVARKPI